MLEAEIAGSKGQLIVKDMHSGSFFEQEYNRQDTLCRRKALAFVGMQ
jgi:hypothetical protein